jgi:hypothetical protein
MRTPVAATIRSQPSAISSPPASAKPSTAAISGQRVVRVELVDRGHQRLAERAVDRVPGLGPVQRDDADAPTGLGEDLVRHALLAWKEARWSRTRGGHRSTSLGCALLRSAPAAGYFGGMRMPPSTRSVSPFM